MAPAPLSRSLALTSSPPPHPPQAQLHITTQLMSSFPAANQLFAHRCLRIQTHWLITSQSYYYCEFITAGAFWVDCDLFQMPSDTWLRLWTQTSSRDKRAVGLSHCNQYAAEAQKGELTD